MWDKLPSELRKKIIYYNDGFRKQHKKNMKTTLDQIKTRGMRYIPINSWVYFGNEREFRMIFQGDFPQALNVQSYNQTLGICINRLQFDNST